MVPVTPITLEDDQQRKFAFRPQSDMTGLEAALLSQLFVKLTLNRSGDLPDWPQYVDDHRLTRHFIGPLVATPPVLEIEKLAAMSTLLTKDGEPVELTPIIEISTNRQIMIAGDMPVPEGWRKAGANG